MISEYKILVFCTSKIYEDRFYGFISTLNSKLVEKGWRVLVFCTESDLYKDNKNNLGGRNIFDLINFNTADAFLLSNSDILDEPLKQKLISQAEAHSIPVIILEGQKGQSKNSYSIEFDQSKGFETIVKHVIEQHKVKKLHFIAGRIDSPQSNERLEIFQKVLKAKHIKFSDSMVSYGDFWEQPTIAATKKLIESDNLPEAIICANDKMAISVISTLNKYGYKCPEDVIVTGFDGITEIFYTNPKITSSLCSYEQLGTETADFLLDIDKKKIVSKNRKVIPTFIQGESCGCKSENIPSNIEYINLLTDAYSRYRAEDRSLSNMSSLIHDAKSIEEVLAAMNTHLLYNVMCCIKTECIDKNVNPNINQTDTTYGDEMYLLLDSDNPNNTQKIFKTKDLIPNIEHIFDHYKIPLIFTPLNNIEIPLGYLCFFFYNYDKQNYTKVNQIASWLSNALSGYRNMQYQRQLQKKIEAIYSHDSLTGLLNRTGFQQIYSKMLNNPSITKISLVMCDLDNLKYINDNFSHTEGDNAISTVAKALEAAVDEGFFCRYGGDELIGLYTSPVDEMILRTNLEEYLETYNSNSGKPYKVSTSIGIYTSEKCSFEDMFKKADDLMYENKKKKKNIRFSS